MSILRALSTNGSRAGQLKCKFYQIRSDTLTQVSLSQNLTTLKVQIENFCLILSQTYLLKKKLGPKAWVWVRVWFWIFGVFGFSTLLVSKSIEIAKKTNLAFFTMFEPCLKNEKLKRRCLYIFYFDVSEVKVFIVKK